MGRKTGAHLLVGLDSVTFLLGGLKKCEVRSARRGQPGVSRLLQCFFFALGMIADIAKKTETGPGWLGLQRATITNNLTAAEAASADSTSRVWVVLIFGAELRGTRETGRASRTWFCEHDNFDNHRYTLCLLPPRPPGHPSPAQIGRTWPGRDV